MNGHGDRKDLTSLIDQIERIREELLAIQRSLENFEPDKTAPKKAKKG
jgi:hypothetical protein